MYSKGRGDVSPAATDSPYSYRQNYRPPAILKNFTLSTMNCLFAGRITHRPACPSADSTGFCFFALIPQTPGIFHVSLLEQGSGISDEIRSPRYFA